VTWLLQVIPVFFLVGGFSHATALDRWGAGAVVTPSSCGPGPAGCCGRRWCSWPSGWPWRWSSSCSGHDTGSRRSPSPSSRSRCGSSGSTWGWSRWRRRCWRCTAGSGPAPWRCPPCSRSRWSWWTCCASPPRSSTSAT
jgi:hypothetical protein